MPGLHEAISSNSPDNMLSLWSLLPGSQSRKSCWLAHSSCGISNNLDGTEDVLTRDSIPKALDAEEDDRDPVQDLDEEDADSIAPFSDPEDPK